LLLLLLKKSLLCCAYGLIERLLRRIAGRLRTPSHAKMRILDNRTVAEALMPLVNSLKSNFGT